MRTVSRDEQGSPLLPHSLPLSAAAILTALHAARTMNILSHPSVGEVLPTGLHIHTGIYMYVYTYIHTYIYIYMHIYYIYIIHTHISIHKNVYM